MVTKEIILKTYKKINKDLVKTPLVYSPYFSKLSRNNVYLKLENFQQSGSFKERGALSFFLNSNINFKNSCVVTASAGNHAQAVALVAQKMHCPITVFMSKAASKNKIEKTNNLGANVRLVGNNYDEAFTFAKKYCESERGVFVHPYDNELIMTGQGTIAVEIEQDLPLVDHIFVPVGGGGLIAGVISYFINNKNKPKISAIETFGFDTLNKALLGDKYIQSAETSIADGIAVRNISNRAVLMAQHYGIHNFVVKEEEIKNSIILLHEKAKVVAEGAGAAALAGFLKWAQNTNESNKNIVIIVSGGNIDKSLMARILEQEN